MKGIKLKIPKETPKTHNLGKLISFYCEKCGWLLCSLYETDRQRGGGVFRKWRYCSICGNALDFGEYYTDKKCEDIIFDD